MDITENDANDLLRKLVEDLGVSERRPNGVTAKELGRALKISRRAAVEKLEKMEEMGEVISEWCRSPTGQPMRIWYSKDPQG